MDDLIFLSHRVLAPPNKGEKIRGWHITRHLAGRYRVHFGCVVDDAADMANVAAMRAFCASVGAFRIDRGVQKMRALLRARPGRPLMPDFYFSQALQRWFDATRTQTGARTTYIYSVAMAPYALAASGRKILDAIDIDSEKWAEYATTSRYPMRAVWAREARNLLRYERHAAASCDQTLFVSEPEAARFRALAPEVAGRVMAVENGVDLERFSPEQKFDWPFGDDRGPNLVFTGTMDYWPNADAVAWFARETLPMLQSKFADLRFWIVGANPGPEVRALAGLPGVHVTGRVEDVRPYVAHAACVVCPLRIARGIQNKVLEAMAMGRPVVATGQAFEGVRARAGTELLVADAPGELADAVGAVLEGRHSGLGKAARAAMERGYAWEEVLRRLPI